MFEKALLDAGFEIEKYLFFKSKQTKNTGCFNINSSKDKQAVLKKINESKANIVIATGFDICRVVSGWKLKHKYLVCDLNGWTPAEVQIRAFFDKSNALVDRFCNSEKQILMTADFVTTVSEAQKFAIYGELSMLGKLNKELFDLPRVCSVSNKGLVFDRKFVEGDFRLNPDSFKVLWLGGFNNWADHETLFRGMELIMDKYSFVELVVTGGAISGVNEDKYRAFEQLVQNSVHKDRYILLNWAKSNQVPQIINQAQLGLNCDLDCLETWTGACNRINEMISNGLAVISSEGREVTAFVKENNLGSSYKSGDPTDMAFQIELAINGQIKIWTQNCRNFEDSYQDFEPLISFCKNPSKKIDSQVSRLAKLMWYIKNKNLSDVWRKLGF